MGQEFNTLDIRSVDIDLPEHSALIYSIGYMQMYLASFGAAEMLHNLFVRGRIAGGDPYPWDICRWGARVEDVTDINEQPLRDEDYPHIQPEDFLAWCDPDPGCFGPEHHWNTYKEDVFKQVLEDAFTYWAKEEPRRRKEYEQALAKYGMRLQS